jgi:hypothetical protein
MNWKEANISQHTGCPGQDSNPALQLVNESWLLPLHQVIQRQSESQTSVAFHKASFYIQFIF